MIGFNIFLIIYFLLGNMIEICWCVCINNAVGVSTARSLLEVIGRVKKGSYLKFQLELSEITAFQIQDIFSITL